jgi:hypothetical protein
MRNVTAICDNITSVGMPNTAWGYSSVKDTT